MYDIVYMYACMHVQLLVQLQLISVTKPFTH